MGLPSRPVNSDVEPFLRRSMHSISIKTSDSENRCASLLRETTQSTFVPGGPMHDPPANNASCGSVRGRFLDGDDDIPLAVFRCQREKPGLVRCHEAAGLHRGQYG